MPFKSVFNTMGTEIGSINRCFARDYSLHFILSTSNRFFLDELLAILKLREKYDGTKIAIVIIHAKVLKDDEVESIR